MAAGSVCGEEEEEEEDRGHVVTGWAALGCAGLHASSSKPMPTLCPPLLKFFPSIKAERVTLMPEHKEAESELKGRYHVKARETCQKP